MPEDSQRKPVRLLLVWIKLITAKIKTWGSWLVVLRLTESHCPQEASCQLSILPASLSCVCVPFLCCSPWWFYHLHWGVSDQGLSSWGCDVCRWYLTILGEMWSCPAFITISIASFLGCCLELGQWGFPSRESMSWDWWCMEVEVRAASTDISCYLWGSPESVPSGQPHDHSGLAV